MSKSYLMVANGLLFLGLMVTSHCILPFFFNILTLYENLICDTFGIFLVTLYNLNGCFFHDQMHIDAEKSYSYLLLSNAC